MIDRKTAMLLALLLVVAGTAAAATAVARFSVGDLNGWEEQTFRGKKKTVYGFVQDGGRSVLKAESRGSASGLVRKMEFDPRELPVLRWSWKITATLKKGDESTKTGDDYAARVYVVFPGTFFWQTRAINYIWANRLPKGTSAPNAFAPKNVKMVAVESGDGNAGKWLAEERNLRDDYLRLFGEEPPTAGAVALMTDSDNTGEAAIAWYGDISLAPK